MRLFSFDDYLIHQNLIEDVHKERESEREKVDSAGRFVSQGKLMFFFVQSSSSFSRYFF